MNDQNIGHVIVINGIQSSGKSSVARRLAQRAKGFRVLTGDDIVRSVPESQHRGDGRVGARHVLPVDIKLGGFSLPALRSRAVFA
ncbi:MAG: hypothetical protein ABR529_05325 [Actinomycetota bacterium]